MTPTSSQAPECSCNSQHSWVVGKGPFRDSPLDYGWNSVCFSYASHTMEWVVLEPSMVLLSH